MCPSAYARKREVSRRWREANRERDLQRGREYAREQYWADPERRRNYVREWRAANPESSRESDRALRAKRKARIDAIKVERGCVDCGYNSHPAALDFDHRPGVQKLFTISQSFRSWELVEAEIAKCDVRCANCHRIVTAERRAGPVSDG
jgi:hypothetical protein